MKIFLTGATGYIGHRIAHFFAEQGHQIHALIRDPKKEALLTHPNTIIFYGDLTDEGMLEKAAQGCHVCIHSAAYAAIHTKTPALFEEINYTGTQKVWSAAQKAGVKKFIYISSAGTLGPSVKDEPVNETIQPRLAFFNEYERTKALAEAWVLQNSSPQMEGIALNLSRVYGPGLLTEANGTTRLIKKIANGFTIVPGNGKSIGNYVYIDDVLMACQQAIVLAVGGNRYIIGGENKSFNQFFEEVMLQAGIHKKLIRLPIPLILVVAHIMEWLAAFGVSPTITPPWVKRYGHNWILDTTKAQTQLGLNPIGLKEGIAKTMAWLQKGN